MTASRDALRREMRARRRALTAAARESAHRAVADLLQLLPQYASANRVAAYMAVDGEVDPAGIMERARAAGKQICLPVLTDDEKMPLLFVPYVPGMRFQPNRYNIPEPVSRAAAVSAMELDLVLTPLVAFDAEGNRLGMGAGYYDRTFSFLHTSPRTKPALVGLAFECQRAEKLSEAPWDVPLAAVVTEQHCYLPSPR